MLTIPFILLISETVNPKDAKEAAKRLLQAGVGCVDRLLCGVVLVAIEDSTCPPPLLETDHSEQSAGEDKRV